MTHTEAQPGLHAHSWRPEDDLMKQFTVWRRTLSGWLAVESRDTLSEALSAVQKRRSHPEEYPGTPTHPSQPQTYRITQELGDGSKYLFCWIGEVDTENGQREIVYDLNKFTGSFPTFLRLELVAADPASVRNYPKPTE